MSLIVAAVDDMFFASKIRAVAEHLGLKVVFARSAQAVRDAAQGCAPSSIVVDLHSEKCAPLELARDLKQDSRLKSVPLIGFCSHVETELEAAAQAAGYDQVLPRSAFTRKLPQLLRGEL